jgi:2-amino-4-hydroxy-6-hydroxymethyldihydropteridine diphosphokinase
VTRALVAFGANLGDPAATFASVAERLADIPGVEAVTPSSLYEAVPVGGPSGQPVFLNGAFAAETTLDVATFFAHLRRLERTLGRERKEAWGPRIIDLDLALFGAEVHSSPSLTTPHPRLHYRRFVLAPAAEVAPDAVHPVLARTLEELHRSAAGLTEGSQWLALVDEDAAERQRASALFRERHPDSKVIGLPPDAIPGTSLVHGGVTIGVRPSVHLPGVEDRRLERDLDRIWDAERSERLWIASTTEFHPGLHPSGDALVPAVDLRAADSIGRRKELIHFIESLAEPVRR